MIRNRTLRMNCAPILLVLIAWAAGCAERIGPETLSVLQIESLKARLGKIGTAAVRFVPLTEIQVPARGARQDAGHGMASGAVAPLEPPSDTDNPMAALLAAALVPVGTIFGGVDDTVKAAPSHVVTEREGMIAQAVAELRMQQNFRNRFLNHAQSLGTFTFSAVQDAVPDAEGQFVDYRQLRIDGIDTVNELAVRNLTLTGSGRAKPDLALRLTARVRLVSTYDNAEIFRREYQCMSGTALFDAWAADGAKRFREAIERCYDDVAARAVQDLYVNNTIMR